jgi:uncharacterized protein YegP (UPF0339 family)
VFRVLVCVVVGLALCTVSLDAGVGKKGKGDGKKVGKGAEVGSIEIYKTEKGFYRYRVKNAEGKTIAMPLPQMHWEKKADCLGAIDELRTTLMRAKPTDVKTNVKKE